MEILILLGLIIFLCYTIETITGFGSIVIAVTFGSFLFPIPELLPVLAPLNIILGVYIVSRYYKKIDPALLFGKILPGMVLGFLLGYGIFLQLTNTYLKSAFGIFIILVSFRELIFRLIPKLGGIKPHSTWWMLVCTIAAGVMHGIYASGGPILVYALSGLRKGKAEFRVTLSCVWLILNSTLSVLYFFKGLYNAKNLEMLSYYWILIPLGIITGEKLHHVIPEEKFKIVVYGLLLFAGIALLL
ncbi:sulfite exporter TauE/SafE family protein [Leptospira stimsonii]|uniref:Probable membrane transporter protein n=1 Tax=Leptospira stimsonii TaxID=2202203 RepID=A0A4R9L2R8_9LEPT|nr:sulfite exporter TauE/SafE family protein [Leptospira stimsonii]RHX83089.1 sulfite exporter TauE/SafE family protein [Leptospira stimsonii]RHX84648.1 sulfite exporter TauE/SafE family protein [Leptospira stimsonii]TGK19058.1 sulfite exporter TauE/SafE family protein [Leptospira stimsonii]TGM11040.1 sulfite exporter TauE/SafE family protein [Leptospira stimsonii]